MNDVIIPRSPAMGLLIIDVQQKLLPAMFDQGQGVLRACDILLACAAEFDWPVWYTEQYPRGLGATEPALAEKLAAAGATRWEKVEFSALRNEAFARDVVPHLPDQLVVAGMESHICVLQTVADLQARGHQVHVPREAVASRTEVNALSGLQLMERCGAVGTNLETLLFGLLRRAGTDAFKRLSPLIR
jgi:nicotinamidase-related amidase